MILRNADIYGMLESAKEKTLVCFGAGYNLRKACDIFGDAGFFGQIDFIADNDPDKTVFSFHRTEKPVSPLSYCLEHAKREPAIFVTMADCFDVLEQLEAIPALKNCDCYLFAFMREWIKPYSLPKNRALTEPRKIPKTIHYCWFGGSPIPEIFAGYMKSWRKFCPDYEIVRWDESNYDYKKNEYMYEAYRHKKWGFVPDYARLDIVNRYGGVYLDTDVELVRSIDDLLCDDAFCGFENRAVLANGLGLGAVAGFPLIAEQLDIYDRLSFVNADGSLNLTPGPRYQSEFFRLKGVRLDNTLQKAGGMTFYPSDVLAAYNTNTGLNITENTYSIHHYAATWYEPRQQKKKMEIMQKYAGLKARLQH